MKKIIHSIRNKPEHVKTRYVIIFAILATVMIVVLWTITLRSIESNDDTIKTEKPFKTFGNIFSGIISETKESYQSQKNEMNISNPLETDNSDYYSEQETVSGDVNVENLENSSDVNIYNNVSERDIHVEQENITIE